MDYLSGLDDSSPFVAGAYKADKELKQFRLRDIYLMGLGDDEEVINDIKPYHKNSKVVFDMDKFKERVYHIETLGGKLPDRKGSQYSGIAQLGINERKPLLAELGITDEEYKRDRGLQRKVASLWFDKLRDRLDRNGFEVTPINLWTAHNLGVGGLNQILHNKISSRTLANIRNQAGMSKDSTAEDYISYYKRKFDEL